jgi:hypothetical protein
MMEKKPILLDERRQVVREINIELPKGELHLLYKESMLPLRKVRDVSPFGICVLSQECAERGSDITLRYRSPQNQIQVIGKVIFKNQDSNQAGLCWYGISFSPSHQRQNIALFNLLTANSDELGGY